MMMKVSSRISLERIRQKNFKDLQRIAAKNRGVCVSKKFEGWNVRLTWRCKVKHEWKATPASIKYNGSWCGKCRSKDIGKASRLSISEFKVLAKKRGGDLLSKSYEGMHKKLLWMCHEGHQWRATPGAIKYNGSWCSECASGLSERIVRAHFEQIFNLPFPKSYPRWLKSIEGNQLELDGYNERLGLAFEHQGEQHYQRKHRFHSGGHTLRRRIQVDRLKLNLCAKNQVTLIVVPSLFSRIKPGELYDWLKAALPRAGWRLSKRQQCLSINLRRAYSPTWLKELQDLAKAREGLCLSKEYLGSKHPAIWKCKFNHIWKQKPEVIKMGHWCPTCSGNARLTIERLRLLAKQRGGQCLSPSVSNSISLLTWQCKKGHIWKSAASNIINGHWCPECAGNKPLNIEILREKAISFGGNIRSKRYKGINSKYQWECKLGHTWYAIASNILSEKSWCPFCSGKITDISKPKTLAEKNGGLCLSLKYSGHSQRLRWQCEKSHVWSAKLASIQKGTWCPTCKEQKANDEMQGKLRKVASVKGGRLISDRFLGPKKKLQWMCATGHSWLATPRSILGTINRKGTWCPTCALAESRTPKKWTLEMLKEFARKKEGFCLAKTYDGYHQKVEWQCKEGHRWAASPAKVLSKKSKNSRWCPFCGRKRTADAKRGDIQLAIALAKVKNGKCLSTVYVNARLPLKWQCSLGHVWTAAYGSVKGGRNRKGTWCPTCAGRKQ